MGWWSRGFPGLGHSWWVLISLAAPPLPTKVLQGDGLLHSGTVPANGGRAKCDVMCADPSPLLTEDQRLLPPQHREPGALPLGPPQYLEEMSEWRGFPLCYRQRG